ncbi:hypothetical protein [Microscilla marina]|uniref:STAS/SEC14 domain-containing protein n=1 Tax=Microscilla marina ATCC 23134 TaxID=313606 RepID=A1ZK88_MICM2|nr:hypothetical protein [Microscilla marina]EAY29114.1 hypothetical protein M23134_02305 [Microscilla marina ATCC 23134]
MSYTKSPDHCFFQNKNYNLYHIAELNLLIVEARGLVQLAFAQEAWYKAIDKAVEFKALKWLIDGSAIELVDLKASEWLSKELFPVLGEKLDYPGQRITANVLPARFYAEMSSKDLMKKKLEHDTTASEGGIQRVFQNFKTFEEAYEWVVNHQE